MSPDGDQAIMFHGTNLDDLWRNGCNGKISRAMPEGHDKMMKRQNGAWVALGTLSLDYAVELPGQRLDGESRDDRRQESNQTQHARHCEGEVTGEEPESQSGPADGEKGVPYHGIFLSFAHEDYAWVMDDEKAKNGLLMRTSMPYTGDTLSRFMRTCPACETFPYKAEALHWESVAGNTEIFTRDRAPIPARAEGNMAVESASTSSIGSSANVGREVRAMIAGFLDSMVNCGHPWPGGTTGPEKRYESNTRNHFIAMTTNFATHIESFVSTFGSAPWEVW